MLILSARQHALSIFLGLYLVAATQALCETRQPISGELFLVRNSGEAVTLPDIEMLWFSKKDIQSFRDEGTKLGYQLKERNAKRQGAMPRLLQMSAELLPHVRAEIESERQEQNRLRNEIDNLQTSNQQALVRIDTIKKEQLSKRAAQSQKIDSEISSLLSERASLTNPLNEQERRYGQQVVDLFSHLSESKHIGYEEFAHTKDPQIILKYITNAEANTGKYDQLIKKAYSYSARGLYFPGIYSKITAFAVNREKLHALLDEYIAARTASAADISKKQAAIDRAIASKRADRNALNTASIDLPQELVAPAAELQARVDQMVQSQGKVQKLTIAESAIVRGIDFSNLPWSESQSAEARYLLALADESSSAVRQSSINETAQKAYARWILYNADRVRTDSRGAFEIPGDAAIVIAFYENQHAAAGRTFSWYVGVSPNQKIRLSQSNCSEGIAKSLSELVEVAINAIISSAVDEAMK